MRELLKAFEDCGASKLPAESEMQRDLDELTAKADSMFEEYAPEIFKAAQTFRADFHRQCRRK